MQCFVDRRIGGLEILARLFVMNRAVDRRIGGLENTHNVGTVIQLVTAA